MRTLVTFLVGVLLMSTARAADAPGPDAAMLDLANRVARFIATLDDAEIAAYTKVVERVLGGVSNKGVDVLFDRFGGNVEHAEITERIQKIAPTLPTELRPVAFKLAVAMSVADLDASDDESDLQVTLAEALGFDEAKVDALTAEVYASLDAGEDAS